MKLSDADLAFAYELFNEGHTWKFIAKGLDVDWRQLEEAVIYREKNGLAHGNQVVTCRDIELAHLMRTNSRLSWNSIGRYLGHSSVSMRSAYSRRHLKTATHS